MSWIKCIASGLIREIHSWSLTLKIGTGVIGVLLLLGIFAPWLTPYDPFHQDYTATLVPPCWPHPFGTDQIGRDILTRVLYGIRVDMTIGFFTTFVPMTYGVVLGAYAGLLGGRFDAVMMRLLDIAMAFPFLVLIIVIIFGARRLPELGKSLGEGIINFKKSVSKPDEEDKATDNSEKPSSKD